MLRARERLNFYAGGRLDRGHLLRSNTDWLNERLRDPGTRLVPVWRTKSLVIEGQSRALTLTVTEAQSWFGGASEASLLGIEGETAYFVLDLSQHEAPATPPGTVFTDLRSIGPLLTRDEGSLLAYARALAIWHGRHRFCGVCGHPTEPREAGHVRHCLNPGCGAQHFPRTDPAVIMLVHDGGDRVVLGRQTIWPPGRHSVLAGFVEPGESLEEAVAREVWEEVGVAVAEVQYHSSQPWPFPSSIMLGFMARATSDRLNVNLQELEQARWYRREELLTAGDDDRFGLPSSDSIARRLIEDWLAGAA